MGISQQPASPQRRVRAGLVSGGAVVALVTVLAAWPGIAANANAAGTYVLKNAGSGQCLDAGTSPSSGTQLRQQALRRPGVGDDRRQRRSPDHRGRPVRRCARRVDQRGQAGPARGVHRRDEPGVGAERQRQRPPPRQRERRQVPERQGQRHHRGCADPDQLLRQRRHQAVDARAGWWRPDQHDHDDTTTTTTPTRPRRPARPRPTRCTWRRPAATAPPARSPTRPRSPRRSPASPPAARSSCAAAPTTSRRRSPSRPATTARPSARKKLSAYQGETPVLNFSARPRTRPTAGSP